MAANHDSAEDGRGGGRTMNDPESARWLRSTKPPRAVALVLHGLNMRPGKMDFLADRLAMRGADCLRAVLTGHGGDREAFGRVTREMFLGDVLRAYREAAARAHELDVPLHLVGYSIGALLALDLMNSRDDVRFDRMVLFAPALTPRRMTRVVTVLFPFPRLSLPSGSPNDYRANRSTPAAAYRALFDSVEHVEAAGLLRSDVPTLVVVDPKDELVDVRALEQRITAQRLQRWELERVSNRGSTLRRRIHHLIADEASLGRDEWARVEARVVRHLGLDGNAEA